ncbi:MAG: DUF4433 domain-containing protein [Acidobacteria bacterium]|nr:DUF4433 domain-containing protein [Acidobacteriota bacterium]
MVRLKPATERQQIVARLQEHQISELFHFTDIRNWPLIQSRGGLFSLAECRRRNFDVPRPGGTCDSAMRDQTLQHHEYVHLCFHWDQPMKYVRQKDGALGPCAILSINPEVLLWRDTKFSDVNAADSFARIGDDASAFEQINLKVARRGYNNLIWKTETARKQVQAEVLVFKHVPINLISLHHMEGCIAHEADSDDDDIPF